MVLPVSSPLQMDGGITSSSGRALHPPPSNEPKKLGIHPAADPILREPKSWEGRDGGAKPLRLEELV